MNNLDDQAWVDALAGRGTDGSPDAIAGARLRAALLAMPKPVIEPVPDVDARREQRLLARARLAGLLPARRVPDWRWLGAALAASLVLAVAAGLLLRAPEQHETVRGAIGTVRLTTQDPPALKRRLLAELRAAGGQATGCERLGVQCIDADIALPPTDAMSALLARYGIALPADGILVIEIVVPEPGS